MWDWIKIQCFEVGPSLGVDMREEKRDREDSIRDKRERNRKKVKEEQRKRSGA